MLLNIEVPGSTELSADPQRALELARSIVIDGPEMFEVAAEELKEVKARFSTLEARRKAITGPIDAAKKEVMDLFRPALEFYTTAEGIIKLAMTSYNAAVEKTRKEEEARLREAAEAERLALQIKAVDLESEGKHEEAAVAEATSMLISAPPPVTEAPKASGVSFRDQWEAEVVDLVALCRWVVEHPDQATLIVPNTQALNGIAKALKGSLNIPGVRPVCKQIVSSRSK